jgi:hypothetical protein
MRPELEELESRDCVSVTVGDGVPADGTVQRSMITQAVITNVQGNPLFQVIGLHGQVAFVEHKVGNTVTLLFDQTFGLPDGCYRLQENHHTIDRFFRLYGDINGDGKVNATDFAAFKQVFVTRPPTPLERAFDYNGDGIVNNADFVQFRSRYK